MWTIFILSALNALRGFLKSNLVVFFSKGHSRSLSFKGRWPFDTGFRPFLMEKSAINWRPVVVIGVEIKRTRHGKRGHILGNQPFERDLAGPRGQEAVLGWAGNGPLSPGWTPSWRPWVSVFVGYMVSLRALAKEAPADDDALIF